MEEFKEKKLNTEGEFENVDKNINVFENITENEQDNVESIESHDPDFGMIEGDKDKNRNDLRKAVRDYKKNGDNKKQGLLRKLLGI